MAATPPTREQIRAAYTELGLTPGQTTALDLKRAYRRGLHERYDGAGGVDEWARSLIAAHDLVQEHLEAGAPSLDPPRPVRAPSRGDGAPGVRIVEVSGYAVRVMGGGVIFVHRADRGLG